MLWLRRVEQPGRGVEIGPARRDEARLDRARTARAAAVGARCGGFLSDGFDDVGFGVPDTFGGFAHTPTLSKLRDQGISVILISHRVPDVFGVSDRIAVLRRGELVCSKRADRSSPEEVTGLITGAIEAA